MSTGKPDALDEHLTGKSALSSVYKRVSTSPAPATDALILRSARDALESSAADRPARSRPSAGWAAGLGLAAVLVLTVSVVPLLQRESTTSPALVTPGDAPQIERADKLPTGAPSQSPQRGRPSLPNAAPASQSPASPTLQREPVATRAVRARTALSAPSTTASPAEPSATGVQAPADTVAPTLREISEQAKTPPPRRAPVPTAIVTPEAIQAQPAAPPPPRRDAAPPTKRAMQTGAQRELEGAAARSEHTNAAGATRPPTVAQRLAAIERLIEAGDIPQARGRLAALAKQFPLLDLTEWQRLLGPSR